MTLAFYIARRFLTVFLGVVAIFGAILFLIDMVDQIRRFADAGITLGAAAGLAALNMPGALYRILPLLMVLAAISFFLGMARSSELVVIRAAGRSGLRMLLAPVTVALILGAVAVAVGNPLVAATSRAYESRATELARGEVSVLSISPEGLWLRQGGAGGQTVIRAARANLDGTRLFQATFLTFAPDGTPLDRIEAREARLIPGAWDLAGVKRWPLAADNPELAAVTAERLRLPSDLTADRIRDSFGQPSAVPIWDLPAFIAGLDRAGFSARGHRVWFQMELAQPLLMAAMVLLAAGFTMRHVRFGRTGIMVLSALAGGFGIFFLRNFAQILGETGQIPVLPAAWIPPVAAVLLAVSLLLHLEEG